ncbi:MAG: GSCFA domain-containing protein [Dysgonomonas sp.]|nr:GSCFA domain-containing protein [Dysgonomonas sp.]
MEFRKKIDIPVSDLQISHHSRMMLLGSCFIENIGQKLQEYKFNANINPFGISYNPASICQSLEILLDKKDFTEKDIFHHEGLYHTFFHHSAFSEEDKNQFLSNINNHREKASEDLKNADILFITFGTSYIYTQKQTNKVVSNCHKLPANHFERRRLSVSEIVDSWKSILFRLREVNPALKILFTVSPIRHWKDGAHNNQISKSVLLLSIDELSNSSDDIYYFPSYEIVLDELRDYRFYAEDMIHPNDTAIRYIWERFTETYFDKETIQINKQWQNIHKAISHRPFNEQTEEHKQFLRQTLLKLNELRNKYPYFECEKERLYLVDKLSQS